MPGIKLVSYDSNWPLAFEREATQIARVMHATAQRIEHVGSTSVPGLNAKPVIDIQISVAQLQPLAAHAAVLSRVGYTHVSLPPPADPMIEHADEVYPFFQKPSSWPSTHHVHLCVVGSQQERNHLVFRDYLRDHPEKFADYLALKEQLAGRYVGDTPASREQYSLGKSDFVNEVITAALLAGYTV